MPVNLSSQTAGGDAAPQPAKGEQDIEKGPKVLDAKTWNYKEIERGLKLEGTSPRQMAIFMDGITTRGLKLEMHLSDLGPGLSPHPPHKHANEEIILVLDGTMEFDLDGQKTTLGPGSVAFIASNVLHGMRNVGTTASRYIPLTIG
jgi:mannose-6-phosphate isomerase-like protein (cupin superfamily)